MKLCNDVITVFNARVDPDAGGNVWVPTIITGAGWFLTDASTVDAGKGGLVAANKATIRIPEGAHAYGIVIVPADTSGETTTAQQSRAYTDPLSYRDAEDVSGLWTLASGDVIVKAEVSGDSWTPARLKKVFSDCVTVLGVTDNRRAPNAPHWRVTGT